MLEMFGNWSDFLSKGLSHKEVEVFRGYEQHGKPLGTESFISRLEKGPGRILHRQKPGLKRSQKKKGNLYN